MLVLRCSSTLPLNALLAASEADFAPAMVLSPKAAQGRSALELAFAFHLARRAFENKENISEKLSNEALLFLAREMNFSSAVRALGALDARDFALVCEKSHTVAKAKEKLGLLKVKRLSLSKMGKKKGAYFEGELAVEEMALARVKN